MKGERSRSAKSALVRRPYPPGIHGQKRTGKMSEFGMQMRSKQKIKNTYRMLEKQFKNSVKAALELKKDPYNAILETLETRLDNIVFRIGFAQSRDQARQIVNHGHILVNGKRVSIPSYHVSIGDEISIREASKKSPYFTTIINNWFGSYEAPAWLGANKEKMTAKIKGHPTMEESGIQTTDLQAIIEFYSR